MRVGLDFDKTLFDTESFIEELPVNLEVFKKSFESAASRDYSVSKHAQLLKNQGYDVDPEEIQRCYKIVPDYFRARTQLERLRNKHELFLITRSDTEGWQEKKINKCKAEKYFDEVIIVSGEESKNQLQLDVMIDDNREELEDFDTKTLKVDKVEEIEEVLERFL